MNSTLYAIADDLLAVDALLTESGGELTPEIEAALASLNEVLVGKVDAIASYIRDCAAKAAALREEADVLTAKRRTEENKVGRLKEYVRFHMDRLGETKLAGAIWTFALQANGGRPALTVLVAPEQLPALFRRLVVQADTDALRGAVDAASGELVVDGRAIARLEPVGSSLRIR